MSNFKKLSAYVDVPCEWVSTTASNNDKLDQLKAENAKIKAENATLRIVSFTSLRVICNHCALRYSSACSSCLVEDALNKLRDQTKKEDE